MSTDKYKQRHKDFSFKVFWKKYLVKKISGKWMRSGPVFSGFIYSETFIEADFQLEREEAHEASH